MVPCPLCKSPTDRVTAKQAASILGITALRVRQLCAAGQLPGAELVDPDSGIQSLWMIPIASVIARKESQ